ncbi:MAG: hypothetical protein ACRENU_06415 [Gemmatimonadaceae bacterium]
MRHRLALALALALGASCDGRDFIGPDGSCVQATGSVTATVNTSGSVTFDWDPACAVALLLIEEDATDMWAITAPGLDDTSTETANIITPPVTYGSVPAGAEQDAPATPLVPGTTYELILWKIVPPNSTVQCQQRFQNACLLTVHPFQR